MTTRCHFTTKFYYSFMDLCLLHVLMALPGVTCHSKSQCCFLEIWNKLQCHFFNVRPQSFQCRHTPDRVFCSTVDINLIHLVDKTNRLLKMTRSTSIPSVPVTMPCGHFLQHSSSYLLFAGFCNASFLLFFFLRLFFFYYSFLNLAPFFPKRSDYSSQTALQI